MARDAITLERATAFCPNEAVAAGIARRFALEPVDYAAMREAQDEAIGHMVNAFGETLGERVTATISSVWSGRSDLRLQRRAVL